MEITADSLRTIDLFSRLSDEDLEALIPAIEVETFSANDAIVEEGRSERDMFIVLEGTIKIKVAAPGGRGFFSVVELQAGAILGELAFMDGRHRSATAIAKEATTVLRISHEKAMAAIGERPSLGYGLLQRLAWALCERVRTTSTELRNTMARLSAW